MNPDHNRSLLLTQQYCQDQVRGSEKNEAEVLRTINPLIDGMPLFVFEKQLDGTVYAKWNIAPMLSTRQHLIEKAFEKQNAAKLSIDVVPDAYFEGRIVCYDMAHIGVDRVSERVSNGFLDIYDIPPIDTWFYISGETLYCWVPKQFVCDVNDAIAANTLGILYWAKGRDEIKVNS